MAPFTPEYTSQVTDLPVAQITSLAQTWGTVKPLAVRVGFGLSHWYHGDLHMQALLTLQAITGNIGVHGGGVTTFAGGITTTAFDLGHWWNPTGKPYTVLEPMDFCDAVLKDEPYPVGAAWFMIDNFAQQMSDRNQVVQGDEGPRVLRRVRLRALGHRRHRRPRAAGLHVPREDRPVVVQQLLPPVHAQDHRPAVRVQVRPRRHQPGRTEDGRRQVLRPVARRVPQPDHAHGPVRRRPTVKGLTWKQLTTEAVHLNTDPMPYVPFYNKQFPTKSGKIEFYVEMLVPFGQELVRAPGANGGVPTNPLFKKYPLVVPLHAYEVPHALTVRNLAVAERDQQRRSGLPGDQPQGRAPRGDLRRGRREGLQQPRRDEGPCPADRVDQARRRQLLPGRMGHHQGQALHRGPPEQPDAPDRQAGAGPDPEFPLQRRVLRLLGRKSNEWRS